MNHLNNLVGASLGAALLSACGGSNSLSSSMPVSVTPQTPVSLAAPGAALQQSLGLKPAYGRYGSHRVKKNESVLYSFAGGSNGVYPFAGLINVGGTLYSTTFASLEATAPTRLAA
jgi:hypothetical protein